MFRLNDSLMFEQDRVLVRLQQRVLREEEILVCFLTGSYGRGIQDSYSDLDVTLVFADEDTRASYFEGRHEFAQSVLPYIPAKSFDATHIRPYFHIALYANGTKVDYLYETKAKLHPTPWVREIRILKDKDGWGQQFLNLSSQQPAAIPHPTISVQTLKELDDRFWVMFMDIYRQLRRGDYDKPYVIYLQLLYFTVPELMALLPEDHRARQGLIRSDYGLDAKANIQHFRELLVAYLAAREAVVRYHKLNFIPDQTFEREILRVIEGS